MIKKNKTILFVTGGLAGVTIIFLLVFYLINYSYIKNIPKLSDSAMISEAVSQQITDAYKKARRNPSSNNLGTLGMVYHSSANYTQAAVCYQLAIERDKKEWIWNYYKGYLSTELGNPETAIENFKAVAEKNPDDDLTKYYIGEEYKNLRENDLAENTFLQLLNGRNEINGGGVREDHFPLETYAMFQISRIYYETGKLDRAEKTLKKLLEKEELYGPAYRLLGNVYATKGEEAKGEYYTTRANDLILFSPPVDTLIDKLVLKSRSELYLLKKIDEAENNAHAQWALKLVNQGMQYMPENKYLISKAIKIYLWNNLDKLTAPLIDKHIQYFSDNFSELRRIGMLYFQKGFYHQAIKYWTEALKLNENDVSVQKNLASSYWNTGEKQKAKDILTASFEKNFDNIEIRADLAYNLFYLNEKDIAATYAQDLRKLAPENYKVQKLAGKLAEINGNFRDAVLMYESAFKKDPTDIEIIHSLENILIEQKMWGEYLEFYKKVIENNPNEPEYLDKMGSFLLGCPDRSLRNLEKGLEYSKRAFTHFTSSSNILLSSGKNLAVAYATKRDKSNALRTINETLNISMQENSPEPVRKELEQLLKVIQNL